ncbi:hypothetical protein IW261DRAFT_1606546 [Armillaria novae-zelandiae]|uniref:Uncharacterized protein n=1 Tax=Armillaria novae-zelandiae TaxID=153914 RepID=A0AA39PG86_9AGAR|nr:hypothetical protein IW261DRAFT_1606546 [Armillaria novae-zelandiae]
MASESGLKAIIPSQPKSSAIELLKRLNYNKPCKEDVDEAEKNAPAHTMLYYDKWCLSKYKFIPKFPDPPLDTADRDHYYFYGFAITLRKLEQIHRKNKGVSKRPSLAGAGLYILREELLGYRDLYLVNAEVDEQAKPKQIVEINGRRMLRILAVACTRNDELFYRRPSLKQMRLLRKHLGCKPRWFKDVVTKDQFKGWDIE